MIMMAKESIQGPPEVVLSEKALRVGSFCEDMVDVLILADPIFYKYTRFNTYLRLKIILKRS